GTPMQLRLFESGGVHYLGANRTRAFAQDNTGNASWLIGMNINAGAGDAIDISHTSAGGATNTRFSLTSTGDLQLGDGIAAAPSHAFQSDKSLGLYRSGVQTIAQSFGTFNLAANAVRL